MQVFNLGDVIDGRYEVVGMLGRGGMAHVFRAYDRHLDREVALKVLRPHLTEADQERFRREIKALAKLSHPGIVSIYDLGREEIVYFAMELVEGGPFTSLGPLEPDPVPLLHLLDAAISVAEALAYVHHHGMVHRDLTPRNILMTPRGQPKVMDFGLVQLAEVSRQLTRTGLTLGTPQYMAPEQAKGDTTGAHTDLYALGAVLYHAVTGIVPFEAENDQAVLYQHVYGRVVPPHVVNPATPGALALLIESLLAKEPNARPASASNVADALRAIRSEALRCVPGQRQGGPAQHGVLMAGPANPRSLETLWQRRLPDGPQWPAAVTAAEGFLLLGTKSEEVYVLRPADGSVQTRLEADDEVNSPVVYHATPQGPQLLYSSRDGAVTALRWPSGERLWKDDSAAAVGGVVPFAGEVLLSSSQGTLERRTATGECRWRYQADEPFATAPTVHRARAYALTRAGVLHGIDSESGKGQFKAEVGEVVAQPSASAGVLLLPERSGDLHAFDTEKLDILWSYDTEGQLWASPVVWQGLVFTVSWSGVMRCLSLKTGDDLWARDLGSKVTAAPVLASGVLYVVTEEGEVVALEARAGGVLFRDTLSVGPIQASPVVVADTLVVAALDGTLRAYR